MGEKAISVERTEEVYKLLIRGYRRYQIIQYASDWGISERQIDTYIAKANIKLEEASEVVRNKELGKAITRLNELYKESFEEGNFKDCKDIQKEINTLLGLAEATKLQIDAKVEEAVDLSKLDTEQLKAYQKLTQLARGGE